MQEIKGHRLERGYDRVLGGVCSGLAHYLSIDPLFVRLVFVLVTLAGGAGVVLYLVLWLFVPDPGEPPREGDVLGAGIRSVEADLRRLFGDPGRSRASGSQPPPPGSQPPPPAPPPAWTGQPFHGGGQPAHRGGLWLGMLLIVLGAVFLATSTGLLTWWNWAVMWPALVIGLGVLILVRRLS